MKKVWEVDASRGIESLHQHLRTKYPGGTGDTATILRDVRRERNSSRRHSQRDRARSGRST